MRTTVPRWRKKRALPGSFDLRFKIRAICIYSNAVLNFHVPIVYQSLETIALKTWRAEKVSKMYKVELRRRNTEPPSSTGSRAHKAPQWPQCQLSQMQMRFSSSRNTTQASLHWRLSANSSATARRMCRFSPFQCGSSESSETSRSVTNSRKILTDGETIYQ